ncbi:kinase-like domain-containing protein [Rhizophagus irregularis DAOM 181602=DAOM 197198]|nr:kinase-like domain-containing protein [Rhizophagus irregularis DAOM 181602=DAOM 197198]
MSTIRKDLINGVTNRAWSLIDYNIHDDLHKQHEFTQKTILADNSLTTDEKTEAIRLPIWVNGKYEEWDSENQQLQRLGDHYVILKELENIENASQNWFEEAKSHLTIKEEQEAFHSKLYDFNIPKNIDDFSQSSNQNSKKITGSKRLSKVFKKLRVNSKSVDTVQNNYYREIQQPQTGDNDDDDEYNNPNLHSKEQEEFEIPDEGF